MRAVLGVIIALSLTACGKPAERADEASAFVTVTSPRPLLSNADAAASPQLRQGLWRLEDADCPFDEAKPSGAWPGCAIAMIVRGDEMLTRYGPSDVGRAKVILLAGYPMIMQSQSRTDALVDLPEYFGLRPVLADGEIVEFRRWHVTCVVEPAGMPDAPKADPFAQQPPPVLLEGYGGAKEHGTCETSSRDLLRAAVIASEKHMPAWRYRWVRSAEQ